MANISIKGIKDLNYLAKGKRGVIYTGSYKGKKVCVKVKREDSTAVNRIENEAAYLKILNKNGIGPKVVMFKDNQLVYEFVEGAFIEDFVNDPTNDKKKIVKMLKEVFIQCFEMDMLKINKEEMSHPFKHIIIKKNPVMIDFERCHRTEKPQNVTQFCQFVSSRAFGDQIERKGIVVDKDEMIKAAKEYKSELNKKSLDKIFDLLE